MQRANPASVARQALAMCRWSMRGICRTCRCSSLRDVTRIVNKRAPPSTYFSAALHRTARHQVQHYHSLECFLLLCNRRIWMRYTTHRSIKQRVAHEYIQKMKSPRFDGRRVP